MKDRSIYLLAIQECIQRITRYTAGYTIHDFLADEKTQDAVIRNIEIIGQAVRDYGAEDLIRNSPDVPWQQVAGMRNIIAHEYLGLDLVLTWEVVVSHLEQLDIAVGEMLPKP